MGIFDWVKLYFSHFMMNTFLNKKYIPFTIWHQCMLRAWLPVMFSPFVIAGTVSKNWSLALTLHMTPLPHFLLCLYCYCICVSTVPQLILCLQCYCVCISTVPIILVCIYRIAINYQENLAQWRALGSVWYSYTMVHSNHNDKCMATIVRMRCVHVLPSVTLVPQCTVHCALHNVQYTVHCTLCIVYSALCIIQWLVCKFSCFNLRVKLHQLLWDNAL